MTVTLKCPACGLENILGEDRCAQCLVSLMQAGLPKPKKDDQFQRAIMTTPISELVTGLDLLVARPSDKVSKIVKIFQDKDKECTLVYERKQLVGILSMRDLLWKLAGRYEDIDKVTVGEIMTQRPEFVQADSPITYVLNKMALGGFRHVPVLDEAGRPFSIITINDLLAFLSQKTRLLPG